MYMISLRVYVCTVNTDIHIYTQAWRKQGNIGGGGLLTNLSSGCEVMLP